MALQTTKNPPEAGFFVCFHHHRRQAWACCAEVMLQLLGSSSVLGSVHSGASSLLSGISSSVSSLLGGVSSSVSGGSRSSSVSSRSGGFRSGSSRSFSSRSGSFHSRSGGSSRSFFLLAASSQSSSSDHGSQNERLLHDNFLLRMSYSVCRTGRSPMNRIAWVLRTCPPGARMHKHVPMTTHHPKLRFTGFAYFFKKISHPVNRPEKRLLFIFLCLFFQQLP